MRAKYLRYLILGTAICLLGVLPSHDPTLSLQGQASGDGIDDMIFGVRDGVDVRVLKNILLDATVFASLSDALTGGPCVDIGFQRSVDAVTGNREYRALFQILDAGAAEVTAVAIDYTYDAINGMSPAMPPDACSLAVSTAATSATAAPVVIDTVLGFEFLKYVLAANETAVMRTLERGWISNLRIVKTATTNGRTWIAIYLPVTRGSGTTTTHAFASEVLGLGFGPLRRLN